MTGATRAELPYLLYVADPRPRKIRPRLRRLNLQARAGWVYNVDRWKMFSEKGCLRRGSRSLQQVEHQSLRPLLAGRKERGGTSRADAMRHLAAADSGSQVHFGRWDLGRSRPFGRFVTLLRGLALGEDGFHLGFAACQTDVGFLRTDPRLFEASTEHAVPSLLRQVLLSTHSFRRDCLQ
jgi:hypothetical protein